MVKTSLLSFAWWRCGYSFALMSLFTVSDALCFFPSSLKKYHEPTKNSAFPLSIYRLIFIFFSTRSLRTGVSHRATFVPRAAKYSPTRPTPQPSSRTDFPVRLNYCYSFRVWRALASTIAYDEWWTYCCGSSTACTKEKVAAF